MPISRIDNEGLTGPIGGRRNIVINGAMNVCQRGTSTSGLGDSTNNGYFVQDRFDMVFNTSGRFTLSQDSDAPAGFGSAMKLACTTADTSIAADEYGIIAYQIEGQDLQHLHKGTSSAKELTLSFYAKANASKTYVVELRDYDNSRIMCKSFTVGTSYSRIELTFPADTIGELDNDINRSFAINIFVHGGSNFTSGTLGTTWASSVTANRAAGCDSFFSSTSNTFFITGVQLEVGSVATEFEHRSFGEEMTLCKRYYHRLERNDSANDSALNRGVASIRIGIAQTQNTTTANSIINLPVAMRVNPTLDVSAAADIDYGVGTSTPAATSVTIDSTTGLQTQLVKFTTTAGGLTLGHAGRLQINAVGKHIAFDSEL